MYNNAGLIGRRARGLLKALVAVPQIVRVGVRPLEWLTPTPTCRTVRFDVDGRSAVADLYRSKSKAALPAVVMTLGANDQGARDQRAINLAHALARSGFLTLVVVGAPGLVSQHALDPFGILEAPAVTAAAFAYLAECREVDPTRIGLVGVCFGGSACLVAAAREDLAQHVAFVFVIGPYFCLRDLLCATVTGFTRSYGPESTRQWIAEAWARARARDWLLGLLSAHEGARVRTALERGERVPPRDLSDQADAVFHLAIDASPDTADALIDALGAQFVAALRTASPAGQLSGLRAPTYVMHGVADAVIPVEESRHLVETLRSVVPVHYAEFELFEHVDATRAVTFFRLAREVWRLVQHVQPMMEVSSG